ncbi:FliH/SctL family protein [Curtobacterium sp. 458]
MTDQTVQRMTFPVLGSGAVPTADPAAEVRGHAAGYAAGLRAAQAETAALQVRLQAEHDQRLASLTADTVRRVAVLDAATNALLSQVVPVLRDAEASLADAAIDLAEAVVGYAIRASRSVDATGDGREAGDASGAEATVLRALASVDQTVALRVRVSAADAARVSDLDMAVPVVGDPTLSDGDAVVDLPDGLLDARIGAALDRAREALGGAR